MKIKRNSALETPQVAPSPTGEGPASSPMVPGEQSRAPQDTFSRLAGVEGVAPWENAWGGSRSSGAGAAEEIGAVEGAAAVEQIKYITANGIRFGYLESGPPDGPLVIAMHGFPDSAHTYDDLRGRLAEQGYRVIAPFTRGYPPTSAPADGDYTGLAQGEDVVALIDAFDRKKATLIGHDWGATAVYTAANLAPEKVEKMITIASPHARGVDADLGFLNPINGRGRHFLSLGLPWSKGTIEKNGFALLDTLYKRWSPTWDAPPEHLREIKRMFAAGGAEAGAGYYQSALPLPFSPRRKRSQEVQSRKTSVPTLTLAGRDDGVFRPQDFQATIDAFTGPYDIKVLPGGHFLPHENPEGVAREILNFLDP